MNSEPDQAPGPSWTDELIPMEDRRRLLDEALSAIAAQHAERTAKLTVKADPPARDVPAKRHKQNDKPAR